LYFDIILFPFCDLNLSFQSTAIVLLCVKGGGKISDFGGGFDKSNKFTFPYLKTNIL